MDRFGDVPAIMTITVLPAGATGAPAPAFIAKRFGATGLLHPIRSVPALRRAGSEPRRVFTRPRPPAA